MSEMEQGTWEDQVPLPQDPPPFTIDLPPGPFILYNQDFEIVASSGDLTIISLDDDSDDFFERVSDQPSWYGIELEVSDAETIESLDVAVRNNQRIVALLDRPGVTGDYHDGYLADAKRNIAEAPARRAELVEEEAEEKREDEEMEERERARNVCTGQPMNGGILHALGTHCPKHGSF